MKFYIFTWHEIIYKWVAYLIVACISLACVVFYMRSDNNGGKNEPLLNNDETTFILSLIYALFLFVITIYMTDRSDKIRNMFYIRKEQYKQLKKLSEIYKIERIENKTKTSDFLMFLSSCQVFTGRIDKEDFKPYVRQEGFSYTKRHLTLEKTFIEQHKRLQKELENRIKNYINSRNLKKTVVNISLFDIDEILTNHDSWINSHLKLESDQLRQFRYFVDSLKHDLRKEIKNLDKTKKKLIRNHTLISKRAKSNIIRLERVYGEKLIENIQSEDNLFANLQVLENLINGLKSTMLTYDEMQEIVGEQYSEIHAYMKHINIKLEMMDDTLIEIRDSFE